LKKEEVKDTKIGENRGRGGVAHRYCDSLWVCSVRERSGTEFNGSIPLEWVGFHSRVQLNQKKWNGTVPSGV
jgi:hypothetical protein